MSAYRTAVGFVVGALAGDTELTTAVGGRIYEGIAPQGAAYPLVTVQSYTDPVDTNYNGSRALTVVDLLIRVWDSSPTSQGSSSAVVWAAADRIDVLLNGAGPIARDGAVVNGCERRNEVSSVDERSGQLVRAAGGRYRLVVS